MANHWSDQGVHVSLLTLAAAETDVYPLRPSVERIGLDVMRHSSGPLQAIANNWMRLRTLRRTLRATRPDVVISFTDQINVLTLLAACGLRLRVVICERVDPRHHHLGRSWSFLRRCLYRRCFAAVVQTNAIREFIQPLVKRRAVYVVPNCVRSAQPSCNQQPDTPAVAGFQQHLLVACGRLVPQKGFDLLIDAFAQSTAQRRGWTLRVLGEGSERPALEARIRELGLEQQVELPGWRDDHLAEFQRAEAFVLSSRYEGFPNVLLEAMACGLPVVSFSCPTGPDEIVRDGVDGILVEPENVSALAAALDRLTADPALQRRMGARAGEVVDRFSESVFYARWQAVLTGANPDAAPFASCTDPHRPEPA